ncbi:peroxiredoxin [Flavobacterium sp.]|uniref:peroxiredoxin n=1 Tax=Flavobacterium sp. TaxID=239 RepID=UPI00286BD2E1|nr:peroxiredoxin [Flavobacterium sp.]
MALEVGDLIPHFTAKNTAGKDFDSSSCIGKKPVVIYFYPKDDTRICTQQACSFRDQYEDFKALGAEVIGISGDSVRSHQKFSAQYQLPFILLSDSDKNIRNLFGVPTNWLGLIPGRVTYVANKEGVIIMVFNSTSGTIHIKKALEALKNNL